MNHYFVTLSNKDTKKVTEVFAKDEIDALHQIYDNSWDEVTITLVDKSEYILPKGHGDLVDRNKLSANLVAASSKLSSEFKAGLWVALGILNNEDVTPALIKADAKENEELNE